MAISASSPSLSCPSSDIRRIGLGTVVRSSSEAYRCCGGLTTPPYSENVTFVILRDSRSACKEQLDAMGEPNARPQQEVNRRVVVVGNVQ